jgi:hypothetical protein
MRELWDWAERAVLALPVLATMLDTCNLGGADIARDLKAEYEGLCWKRKTKMFEMPCMCDDCNEWFELTDGYSCDDCDVIFCPSCLPGYREPRVCDTCKCYRDESNEDE